MGVLVFWGGFVVVVVLFCFVFGGWGVRAVTKQTHSNEQKNTSVKRWMLMMIMITTFDE